MELLPDIVARGVDAKQKQLFIIDESKAIRAAIYAVFGADQPVQRYHAQKLRNAGVPTDGPLSVGWKVLDQLPKEQKEQVKSLMRRRLKDGVEGEIRKLAEWLEREYPSSAVSRREGLKECFTISRLGLPPSLQHCLTTTNIIESPHAGVRVRTRRITYWQNGSMARR
jgi:transposase-like protein